MKLLISFYILIFFSANSTAQETIAIPDIGLEECLIDLDIDSNGLNGNILVSDAQYVVNLNINDPITNKLLPNVHSKIKDLTGLESFPNLKRLDCFGNEIKKIDLSKSTSITFLNCSDNQIESLDLSNNIELVYVSCDNNKLTSLIIGDNHNLNKLYSSWNNLTTLDVKGATELESLDTTGNKIKTILVNDKQLNNIPVGWYKDENTVYSTALTKVNTTATIVKEDTEITPNKVNTPLAQPLTNTNQITGNASNHYQKFQLSVVNEYDELLLNNNHTQSKKNQLQQKYNLTAAELTSWIASYSSLNAKAPKITRVRSPEKHTISYLTKFKKEAVNEYENSILNSTYLQNKKEEIHKKYNVTSDELSEWISLFGDPSLRAIESIQSTGNAKIYYEKYKKSVVQEYEYLVLNPAHLESKKIILQRKYNLTLTQLNAWIRKHSKIKVL